MPSIWSMGSGKVWGPVTIALLLGSGLRITLLEGQFCLSPWYGSRLGRGSVIRSEYLWKIGNRAVSPSGIGP